MQHRYPIRQSQSSPHALFRKSYQPRGTPPPTPTPVLDLFKLPWILLACMVSAFCGHWHGRLLAGAQGDIVQCDTSSSSTSTTSTYPKNDGWHSVDVFYGHQNHLKQQLPPNQTWFSQVRQDEAIVALLKGQRNGYFIDLAANDATELSNTYSLEQEYGWTGLCIEPNPIYWSNLTYRDCQVVGAVVGAKRMEEVWFRFDVGDHGGIAGDGFDNGKRWQAKSKPRYTVTLKEILERYKAPKVIDYLSLDVEGAEEFIMSTFPLDEYTIKLLTVERIKGQLRANLESHGYQYIKRMSGWGESMWAHKSIVDQLDLSVLDQFGRQPRKEEPKDDKPQT